MNKLPTPKSIKRLAPFSLRLSQEEKAELLRLAGSRPLGEYIKDVLFVEKRSPKRINGHQIANKELFAKALGVLGKSRLASNINQLAKAANSGSLPVDGETTKKLNGELRRIKWLRNTFIAAMGLKPVSSPEEQDTDDPHDP